MPISSEINTRETNPGLYIQILFLILLLFPFTGVTADLPLQPPQINASAWLLIDHDSATQLAQNNIHRRFPLSHIGKIMVAYTVFNALKTGQVALDDLVIISEHAANARGNRMFVPAGTRVPLKDLLQALVIGNANDAAVALAEHVAVKEKTFVDKMNQHAQSLEMENSKFVDVTGRPGLKQYTCARDIALLVGRIINDYPKFYQSYSQKLYTLHDVDFHNRNALLWQDQDTDGVIAIQTRKDGFHMIASAKRHNMRLTVIVLGAPSERGGIHASQQLLRFGFNHFETRRLYQVNTEAINIRVWLGDRDNIPLGSERDLYLTLRHGQFSGLKAHLKINGSPYAPIKRGQRMGSIGLYLGKRQIGNYPLIALQQVETGSIFRRTLDHIEMWLRDSPDEP